MNSKMIRYFTFFMLMGFLLTFLAKCDSLKGLTKGLADAGLIDKNLAGNITTGLEAAEKLHGVYKAYNKEFTPKEEYYIGRTVAAFILSKNKIYGSGTSTLEQYIQKIGQTLAMASNRPGTFQGYRFIVLKSPNVNAYAVPSGYIFFTTGLIQKAANEDELAGVLAHEVSHVVLKHPVKSISDGQKTAAVADLAKFGVQTAASKQKSLQKLTGTFNKVIGEVQQKVEKGYGVDKENEADLNSVQLMINAGYNPRGLSAMLRKLKKGGGVHQDPQVRAKNVDSQIAKHGKKVPNTLATRTARFNRTMPKGAIANK